VRRDDINYEISYAIVHVNDVSSVIVHVNDILNVIVHVNYL